MPGSGAISFHDAGARTLSAFSERLGAPTLQQAMALACQRLRLRVEAAGWRADLPSYVQAFGVRVLEAPITQACRLDYENGHYVIRIKPEFGRAAHERELDPTRVHGRQRFSIAHELGHALMMEVLGDSNDLLLGLHDPNAWEQIEVLCDQAAVDLLLPIDVFLASVRHHGFAQAAVRRIASEHLVSRAVVIRRFIDDDMMLSCVPRRVGFDIGR